MRNPPFANRSFETFYAQVLEQVQWVEEVGLDSVWLPEHHFVDDGFTPSPLLILSAIAARTTRIHLGTNLMVPAFHNPIRLAEDAATLSIVSNGRFDIGLGLGYLKADFEAFGQRVRNRVSLMEDTVEVLRRTMRGQSLAFESKRFHLPDATIAPAPIRAPRILMGGHQKPALERVARIADGFLSGNNDNQLVYLQALADAGKAPADGYICALQRSIVAEDPEAVWAEIGDCALYAVNRYVGWGAFPGVTAFKSRDELAGPTWPQYNLMDGPTAIDFLTRLLTERPQIRDVHYHGFMPGESIESSSARLEYFARNVVPRVRENLRAHRAGAPAA
jgi:alkanesulfonate monooxygenase SsuD/methylene tetrahydromethanopterin reductase-like flavin-dependent oxidoreductase (luciferase family)